MKWVFAVGCWLLPVPGLAAQQSKALPPIDTDRPDLTDGTGTVAKGHQQLESGYTIQWSRDNTVSHSVPEWLLRLGLFDGAELRIAETFRTLGTPIEGVALSGWDDVQVGTKIRLAAQKGLRPSVSMEAFTSLATGAAEISAGRALPGAALLAEWDSDGPWSAGVELQGAKGVESGVSSAVSLSIQFRPSDPVQFYGEVYTLRSNAASSPAESYFNAGILLLLTNSVQIDARIGFGLTHDADRSYFGLGLALRR